jgi:hypothetical protein
VPKQEQLLDPVAGESTVSAKPPLRRRRHRPREETRALLLDAATRLVVGRIADDAEESHNALADVKIKDVLGEVNRVMSDEPKLTTGAFYQIWDDQADFQRALLEHVMSQIATPGAREIEAVAFQMVSDLEPADEILRRISDLDFRVSRSPEMFLALGLGATVPADMVRHAQVEANSRYLDTLSGLLGNVLRYGGRRLRPDRSMEDLIWATEALEVGYLLRSRTDPDVPERTDDAGWTARASAFVGVVHAFTEVVPASEGPA